jgi:hypothetical protein
LPQDRSDQVPDALGFSGQLAGDLVETVVPFAVFASDFTYTVNVVP